MYDHVRTYRTARAFFAVLEFLCYVGLLIQAITFVVGLFKLSDPYGGVQGLVMMLGSFAGIFGCLIGIAMVQVGRAVVDNAESSREMLQLVRLGAGTTSPQAEPSAEGLGASGAGPAETATGGPESSGTYRGFKIVEKRGRYVVPLLSSARYESLVEAHQMIDRAIERG